MSIFSVMLNDRPCVKLTCFHALDTHQPVIYCADLAVVHCVDLAVLHCADLAAVHCVVLAGVYGVGLAAVHCADLAVICKKQASLSDHDADDINEPLWFLMMSASLSAV